MTWSERRIITILSAILALLSAALLIVLGLRYRENRPTEEPQAPVLPGPVQEEEEPVSPFKALTYYNGNTTLSFSLAEDGSWVWSDDTSFPLDTTNLMTILEILNNWDPQQTIKDPAVIADSGITVPSGSLKASTDTGFLSLLFGKTTTDGQSYYVQLNDDESTVYIIDKALYELMCVPIFDMFTMPELPEFTEETLQSIIIRGATAEDGTLGLSTSLSAQRPEGDITGEPTWRSGGANVTSAKIVRDLLSDVENISFDRCILYRPSEDAEILCGFDTPTMLYISYATAEDETAMLELQIGAHLPDESGRYVRLADSPAVFSLPTATLDPLMHISVLGLDG